MSQRLSYDVLSLKRISGMNPIAVSRCKSFLSSLLTLLLLPCASAHLAIGQQIQSQAGATVQTVSLTQMYWFFLSYQQHLDNLATQHEAQGKNGDLLRNALQRQLLFSDSDFAQIRDSAQRLVQQVTALDAQAAAIRAAGMPPTHAQLAKLSLERQSAIDGATENLAQTLSPGRKAALDAFLPRFFHQTVALGAATSSAGVQQ